LPLFLKETHYLTRAMPENYLTAFLLTFLAGASTVIGGFLTFFVKKESFKVLSLGMSFSAGVMIYVSFMEMLPASTEALARQMSERSAGGLTALLFFAGLAVCALIDRFFPEHISGQDIEDCTTPECREQKRAHNMRRIGFFTVVALTVHNFPEGLSVFVAGADSLSLGLAIAVAIALHNIPEGIAVALPIYSATGSRSKAILWSFVSGMAEPLGAVVGFFALKYILPDYALGGLLALTAGIMVFLSIDELLPASKEYEDAHESIIGVVCGMLLMAVSLYFLN